MEENGLVPVGHSASNDLCQVSFSAEDIGGKFRKSKKKITWVFSLAGTHHTVAMVWSKRTGKQHIEMDDKEEWFGRTRGASIFNHQWVTPDGMQLHVIASRTAPTHTPDFRKYELMINSRRFSSLPPLPGTTPQPEVLNSIVTLLYPDGYKWDDPRFRPDPTDPISSADEYQKNENLRNKVYARRIVRHDGTPR